MAAEPKRWTEIEMLTLAARGLGKVDVEGDRGATRVTLDEITAMAGVLAVFGLVPIPPGGDVPAQLIVTNHEGGQS